MRVPHKKVDPETNLNIGGPTSTARSTAISEASKRHGIWRV